MMNSRSSQPADLPSPSAQPPCRSPWCHPGRLYAPLRSLIRKCLVTNKRWSWRKEAGGWGGGSWRSVAHLNPPSLRRFLQFGKVRNTKTSKLPGNQIFNFVATVDLFVFLPKALQSAGNFTHDITHSPATDSFTSCIYLPWVPFKKTCWVKKTSGKSDAFK